MSKLKFICMSTLGVLLFLVPMGSGEDKTIFIAHVANYINNNVYDAFEMTTVIIAWLVTIMTVCSIFYTPNNKLLNRLFKTTPFSAALRIAGSLLYIATIHGVDLGVFTAEETGQVMAGPGGLLSTLYITFFVGILLMPLLTSFGAVEFIGTLVAPAIRKLFKVPGYAAVDAIASFVGDGTIGIVVTDTQYQRGYYSKREAAIIATSFSIVGIAFAAAVAEELGFASIFPIFYGSIALVTVILALIVARLPLKKFPDTYYDKKIEYNEKEDGESIFKHAVSLAEQKAANASIVENLKESFIHILDIYIGFLPIIMIIGTTGLVIAEYTNFFSIITIPVFYMLQFLGFDATVAADMAPAMVVGIADMYLPALFITESTSTVAKFVIGVLSFSQLVFLSETGMVLVKSKIGFNLWDVIKVFIFRTVVSFPIVLLIAYGLSSAGII